MSQAISQEEFDRLADKILIDYVADATPVLWHQMAMAWSNDNANTFFKWLIENRETDRATALMMYWMAAPQWSKKFHDRQEVLNTAVWYIDDFDFIENLEGKLLNGFFVNSNFAYNPANEYAEGNQKREYIDKATVREIPASLYKPLDGLIVPKPTNFVEGFPPDIVAQWSALSEKYEIRSM